MALNSDAPEFIPSVTPRPASHQGAYRPPDLFNCNPPVVCVCPSPLDPQLQPQASRLCSSYGPIARPERNRGGNGSGTMRAYRPQTLAHITQHYAASGDSQWTLTYLQSLTGTARLIHDYQYIYIPIYPQTQPGNPYRAHHSR